MYFAITLVVHLLWIASAYSFVYLKKQMSPMYYFLSIITATIWALPSAYKLSFGG